MNIYPAIDLKDGKCVRLLKGRMEDATEFNPDPANQAVRFREAGFDRLHLVDLNGAFDGRSTNEAAVRAVLNATDAPVQLGGGIRDRRAIDNWLERGVTRVILGTMALRNPATVKAACRDHPEQIVVGIDARGGKVAVEGWAEQSEMDALDLAKAFEDAGVAAIVFTDIDRDGALQGVNAEATAELARAISIPVIASGGVAGIEDVKRLKALEDAGIEGVIIGRALYDGRLEPMEALRIARDNIV
ncbi:1-(5-phosphoribosyl)-5-[(5-phosphoribosylamino)methylideneamino]imidazole-4-carboxamide isomerase [Minwuia thermotolerans]|uniref:1-(5-phosphoribosyl)-5-[(5-phosphoribosylamino)methylideneamino] imidazole-4-carboxamide isomerase n=1 Tax=Minwuia thermotolerans TaxID=2056226 RepID=A0A2M9FYM4_9PROT|nr:1-(5-phosphoribosyl)-5-[(5-phosphoribosylamino)methylideneamino]imidazole-4-carboxamide isomerase [Minwuia thermotolerans]PJK28558.1 1-(5-phosphoribosyl)-5-[(5-phosphoribosylamino)methylideneamino]imidazole-4-carboxamide isomerase [Minwuia thermotolerans]